MHGRYSEAINNETTSIMRHFTVSIIVVGFFFIVGHCVQKLTEKWQSTAFTTESC